MKVFKFYGTLHKQTNNNYRSVIAELTIINVPFAVN